MATAYLGLGTNVGNKRGNLVTAAALLAERVGDVLALSDMYETEPWGFESDNTFLNAVIVMTTELSPMELLDATRLLRIHFMLCQIFHVDLTEITQARMQCQESELAILDLQTFHQLTAKMQSCGRSHNRTFFRGENILITILVFRFHLTFDDFLEQNVVKIEEEK